MSPEISDTPSSEPVWKYRGYELKASEFNTAMAHFFRAEISRMNVWRQRLDATTNWAVVTTGAAITLAFNTASGQHPVIILNMLLVTLFLAIEARRYRYYELWGYRVRLMETDYFAAMLVPPFRPSPDWAESLAENLLHPQYSISVWEAFGRRYRRNYFWIYIILMVAWVSKIWLQPATTATIQEFFARAAFGSARGEWIFAAMLGFNLFLMIVGLVTVGLQQATGEVLPHSEDSTVHPIADLLARKTTNGRAWFRGSKRRKQLLAMIITDHAQVIGQRIIKEMRRGVTSFSGTGVYTNKPHTVLMVAITITEVNYLKTLVREESPKSFVIVTPAHEIIGTGFLPLDAE